MTWRAWVLVLPCAWLGAACGPASAAHDGGAPPGADAGVDSGAEDAGSPNDAGTLADAGAVADGGAPDAGTGPCAGQPAGTYCGSRLGLDPQTLFQCTGAEAAVTLGACAEGCNANATGQDRCYFGSCAGQVNGAYCGNDQVGGNPSLLYSCGGGKVTGWVACGGGCQVRASGQNDVCASLPDAGSGSCTGRAAGIYCGARLGLDPSSRFQCTGGGAATLLGTCGQGCAATSAGTNDQCFSASCTGQVNGAYCGSDSVNGNPGLLYVCQSGQVSSFSGCSGGCVTNPPGQNDYCASASAGAPSNVHAAAGNAFAELRWTVQAPPATGFTVTLTPGGSTVVLAPTARSARLTGLTNGTTYSFTVTPDTGPVSLPSNAVTPDAQANIIPDVGFYPQQRSLTCEEAALSMALAHAGIAKTEAEVLNAIGIDWTPSSVTGGVLHWGDPYAKFVGDPSGSEVAQTGYGTYYPTLRAAAAGFGATVLQAGENTAPAQLYAALLAGHPAVVWISYDWTYHPAGMPWLANDGRQLFWHGAIEHAITLVGVTPTQVLVNNPSHTREWDVVSKTTFETAWSTYNNMAVVLQ